MPPEPPRPNLTHQYDTDKYRLIDALFARLDAVDVRLGMTSENSSKSSCCRPTELIFNVSDTMQFPLY